MPPDENVSLFKAIMKDFHDHGILQDFILIGSWALQVYAEHFEYDPQIPIVATHDIDLLISNPPKISRQVDVTVLLAKYGLDELRSPSGDYAKFVGPDIEVDFLYPMKGRGESGGKTISELGIVAQPLRYMNFIQDFPVTMSYRGIPIRVSEPVVFVLMKYLLTTKRKSSDTAKITKDLYTADSLASFLLEKGFARGFRQRYEQMPGKWQKDLRRVMKENNSGLLGIL